ncbi:hypothetical protein GQ600_22186 [Phytophthora cactorum]|nr:hypothetical protein GQ600_22186 [Phytophthora cactorum]
MKHLVLNPGESLGSNGLVQETRETNTRETRVESNHEYSRFAIVAWPSPQGVKKCSNVRTSWYGCCCNDTENTKPRRACVAQHILGDAKAYLSTIGHILCELLVEAGDPIPVNFFFEHIFLSLK